MSKHQSKKIPLLLPAPTTRLSRLFPHYTRFIAATTLYSRLRRGAGLLLWLLLAGMIGTNVVAAWNPWRISMPLPISANKPGVLGVNTNQEEPKSQEQANLKTQYMYWGEVLRNIPDYRDAHFQAALLAFQLDDIASVNMHLTKIKDLDPNFAGIASLEALLPR